MADAVTSLALPFRKGQPGADSMGEGPARWDAWENGGGRSVAHTFTSLTAALITPLIDFFWNWAKDILNLAVLTELVLSPLAGMVIAAGLGLLSKTP